MLVKPLYDFQDPPVEQFLGRGNLLVAFAMGLGKTPIGIACAEELIGCGDIEVCMIVCEGSLMYQWAQRIAQFTDIPKREIKLRVDGKVQRVTIPRADYCSIIEGKTFQRAGVRHSPAEDRRRQYDAVTTKTDYIILSYDSVVSDARWVRRLMPGLVILDEATAIKSFSAERSQVIKAALTAPYRLALTGTPVDNKLEELYSIMQWVDPDVLGRWDLFDAAYIVRDDYGRVKRYKNINTLRDKIAPAIARIAHDDHRVASYIPKAVHSELYVTPDPKLKAAHDEVAGELLAALSRIRSFGGFDLAAYYAGKNDENSVAGEVMAKLGALDMLLAHPDLIRLSGERYEDSKTRQDAGEVRAFWPGSKYAYQKWQEGLVAGLGTSPKLEALAREVPKILAEDDRYRVMIYTRHRDMLERMAEAIGLPHVLYHGGMNARAKAAAQARFTDGHKTRLFISSHAGARGVDLYRGSHLINYDLPWASGMADQINGRHVRASSQFEQVYIWNMITEDTTELWKRDVLGFKRTIGSAVLDGKVARHGEVENSVKGLRRFLEELLRS